jgi:hypothetical protein
MCIRMTEEREKRLQRAMDAMDENTKAGAIDTALKHYLADLRNKSEVADEIPVEIVDSLSTPQIPIERETTIGAKI